METAPNRSANDRQKGEALARYRDRLTTTQADPDIAALMAARGYSSEKITEGLALADAATAAYGAKGAATGDKKAAAADLKAADAAARDLMGETRSLLLAVFPGAGDREALGIDGDRLSNDRDLFLTESETTLAAVRTEAYAASAAEVGLDVAALDRADAALDTLRASARAHRAALGERRSATEVRDAAYGELSDWMVRFGKLARIALKDRPDLRDRLGL
jgi:hypothetical protein